MDHFINTSASAWESAAEASSEALLKASLSAISESDSRYRQLVDSLPEAVYCCDRDGRVTLFNEAAVTLWGRRPVLENAEFWCGSHKMFTMDGTWLPHDECPMAVALLQGTDFGSIEAVVERPGGERRYVLAHPRLIRNAAGDITGATNVVIDITERKLMEDALRAVDKSKDAFFAMLAHELRNPLAPIFTAATIIKMVAVDPKIGRAANIVERQVSHLARLVDDLLDVSRMANGTITLKKALVSLDHVIECALDVALAAFEKKSQQVTVTFDKDSTTLFCDATRISQVLGNVLVNAAKYSDDGGAVSLVAQVRGADLLIDVSDDGIGIAFDKLDDIFRLYSQIDGAADRARGGLGIGLALVRNLVELHGGSVSACSDGVGHGSCIKIALPIVLQKTPQA